MSSSAASSISARIAAVSQRYESARKQLRDNETEELRLLQLECEAAGHHFKLNQIAGEGRTCAICGANDGTDD